MACARDGVSQKVWVLNLLRNATGVTTIAAGIPIRTPDDPNIPSGRKREIKGPNFNGPYPPVAKKMLPVERGHIPENKPYDRCLRCREPLKNNDKGKAVCNNAECTDRTTYPMLERYYYPPMEEF